MNEIELTLPPGSHRPLQLAGAAGVLEALLSVPERPEPRGGVVVCHPHPLYGGAMSNKVVYALATAALRQGFATLRFNFRGVGRSEGVHDQSRGEAADTVALAQALRRALPEGRPLVLAGFSFGAYVALKAAGAVRAAALMSVAPPFKDYFDGELAPPHPRCPWRAIHSRDDEIVDYDATAAELARYEPPPELITVDGAGHFFHGRLKLVEEAFTDLLEPL